MEKKIVLPKVANSVDLDESELKWENNSKLFTTHKMLSAYLNKHKKDD